MLDSIGMDSLEHINNKLHNSFDFCDIGVVAL